MAIEHTSEKFEKFQTRLTAHPELTNLVGLHGDGIRWTQHLLQPNTISRCFFLYPNPEPKAANKRWFRSPFFHCLKSRLIVGGEIILATNIQTYWLEALEYGEKFWHLEIQSQSSFRERSPRTHFEKKYLERGETCYEAVFVKTKEA